MNLRAKQEPARERVYAYVKNLIMTGGIKPGQFLEEEQVCAAVGVSRTPVREAFHRLDAAHFIDLIPRRGAMIRQVTAQELVQVYETRRMFETHVVRRIAEERLPLDPAAETLLERLRTPDKLGDFEFQAEGNFALHRIIVATLGNDVMLDLYDGLQLRQHRVAISAIAASPGRLPMMHDQHADLLHALRAGDADRAVAVLSEHLRPVSEVTSKLAI